MTWPDILRSAIRDSGKTTYSLAKECGVHVQMLDRFVGGSDMRLTTAEKVAGVVGVTLKSRRRKSDGRECEKQK
jgi:hypothetical protein